MKKLFAILLTFAMILSMTVAVGAAEVTVTTDVPVTKENHVVSGGYSGYTHRNDSTKMNYDAKNKTLSIASTDVDLVGFKVPESDYPLISDGKTVSVRITGYSDCDFRVWLSVSNGGAKSNMVKASDLGFKVGSEFDLTFVLTALDGTSNNCIAIKAASWGANLNGLTIKTISYSYTKEVDDSSVITPTDPESPEELTTVGTNTGYFSTGDDTHAIIIGDAIITSNHEFDANGNCIYCGYHKDVEEEVVIETPVESTEEEVDTDDTDEEGPTESDENPTTGIALALLPMTAAAAVVVITKRK